MKKILMVICLTLTLPILAANNSKNWSDFWKDIKVLINPFSALSFEKLKDGFKTEEDKENFHKALKHPVVRFFLPAQVVAQKAYFTGNRELLAEAVKAGAHIDPRWFLYADAEFIRTYGNKDNLNQRHTEMPPFNLSWPNITPLLERLKKPVGLMEDPKVISALVESGADPLVQDNYGNTPAHYAMTNITEQGADRSKPQLPALSSEEKIARHLQYLKILQSKAPANIFEIKNNEGKSAKDILQDQKNQYCSVFSNFPEYNFQRCKMLTDFEQKFRSQTRDDH